MNGDSVAKQARNITLNINTRGRVLQSLETPLTATTVTMAVSAPANAAEVKGNRRAHAHAAAGDPAHALAARAAEAMV